MSTPLVYREALDRQRIQQVVKPSNPHEDCNRALLQFRTRMEQLSATNLGPLLGMMLNIRGKPFGLDLHPPFEEFFNIDIHTATTFCCGRQIAKSTSLAAMVPLHLLVSSWRPFSSAHRRLLL